MHLVCTLRHYGFPVSTQGVQEESLKCLTKKTVTPNSGLALGDRYCTLQVSKDFIILKINVKITEKLSSVLLLNLEILQHQVFTPFVREIKLAAPFYIPTYKVKNSDKTFQTYELNVGLGTLFLSTFPTKHKRN